MITTIRRISTICALLAGTGITNPAPAAEPPPRDRQESKAVVEARSVDPIDDGVAEGAEATDDTPAADTESPDLLPLDLIHTLRPGYEVRRQAVWSDGTPIADGDVAAQQAGGSRLVYSNTLGPVVFGSSIAAQPIADDIITVGADGCLLDRFVFRVSGDSTGIGAGPFSVSYALYETCPGATFTPGAPFAPIPIPGTTGTFDAPDNGVFEVEVVIPPTDDVRIPSALYLGLTFSRTGAGVVFGAPAEVGFSADRFDWPDRIKCNAAFPPGFPATPHGSFWAQVFVRGECAEQFPIYSTSQQAGNPVASGQGNLFADDITLNIDQLGGQDCLVSGYEVTLKASRDTGSGSVFTDLRGSLDRVDPVNGGVLPGTRNDSKFFVFGARPQKLRVSIDPPISLASLPDPSRLFVGFVTTSSTVGPVLTCRPADIGETEDAYHVFRNSRWEPVDAGRTCHAAFDVTIFCAGSPPAGACCDMALTENKTCIAGENAGQPCFSDFACPSGNCAGDSVCRDVPRINCPFPDLWAAGTVCASTCVGGVNDGQPCTRQLDCPEGDCPGQLAKPCGVSQCCTQDDFCFNLTEKECFGLAPIEKSRVNLYLRGAFCHEGFECPFGGCLGRDGDCQIGRRERGCRDPFCCTDVCNIDQWCCEVTWDRLCVRMANETCAAGPANDSCLSSFDLQNRGIGVPVNDSVVIGLRNATAEPSDPPLCCNIDEPGASAFHTVWFNFMATHASARIRTCSTQPSGDTLIQVFRATDPSTPETACDALQTIACNDDAVACGDGRLSDVCVTGLTLGETYYVLLGTKTLEDDGTFELTIKSPCQPLEPTVLDDCNDNGIHDGCDIGDETSLDCNGNGVPDECDVTDVSVDVNRNGVPDVCELLGDCDDNGLVNLDDARLLSQCLEEPASPVDPLGSCRCDDLNGDGFVDLRDVSSFMRRFGDSR